MNLLAHMEFIFCWNDYVDWGECILNIEVYWISLKILYKDDSFTEVILKMCSFRKWSLIHQLKKWERWQVFRHCQIFYRSFPALLNKASKPSYIFKHQNKLRFDWKSQHYVLWITDHTHSNLDQKWRYTPCIFVMFRKQKICYKEIIISLVFLLKLHLVISIFCKKHVLQTRPPSPNYDNKLIQFLDNTISCKVIVNLYALVQL